MILEIYMCVLVYLTVVRRVVDLKYSQHTHRNGLLVCFIRECILILKILRHGLWFLSPIRFHFLTLLGVSHFKLHVFKFFSHNFYHFLSLSCVIRNFFQFTIFFFRCFNPHTEVSFLNFSDCIFYLVLSQTSVFHTIFFTAPWLVSSPLIISCSSLWYYLFLSLNILNILALKYSTRSIISTSWTADPSVCWIYCHSFVVVCFPGLYNFFISSSSSEGCVPQVCRPPCRVVLYLQLPGSSRCHWD